MKLSLVVIALMIGIATSIYFRRRRAGSWRVSQSVDDAASTVQLVGGPWAGQRVNVKGLPAKGAEVQSWTTGLVGDGVRDGRYVVIAVDPTNKQATATWELYRAEEVR
jgi:hypothetical protein